MNFVVIKITLQCAKVKKRIRICDIFAKKKCYCSGLLRHFMGWLTVCAGGVWESVKKSVSAAADFNIADGLKSSWWAESPPT